MEENEYKEYDSPFFAMISRMKYISRWALMRNSYPENISEHSLEVAMLAHVLAIISNKKLGNQLNAEKAGTKYKSYGTLNKNAEVTLENSRLAN